jgi:molybdate transport system substrate-binding protein
VTRLAALAMGALLLAGCGGGGDGALRLFAASSLTEVFQQLAPKAQATFAGSDELAFQLEQGAKADVYASASPKYPERLYREKLVERPRAFATNSLVLIVPKGNSGHVTDLGSLMKPDIKLVLGAEGVPVGDYARKVLDRFCGSILQLQPGKCPRARIVSEEQDAKGVVSKVALGEADAGLVYATDVKPVADKVRALEIGRLFQPTVRYEIAVLRGAKHRDAAETFVALVTGPRGRAALRNHGFGLP